MLAQTQGCTRATNKKKTIALNKLPAGHVLRTVRIIIST
jgi:hypothetical protein